jgi:hypothetical protein
MTDASPKMYCANHPNVETTLRCNKCEKPICAKCAFLTPTGYRCKECIKGQQKIFETAQWLDYPIIFVVVALLAYLGSLIALRLGFFIILLAPIAAVVGCIPLTLQIFLQFSLLGLIWHAAYAVLMTSALYTRLAGIKIG